ncbi:hypothetical protein [Pedobacter sp. BS3]|nr:hypothetical protein [Pedobacter sp. BS3]
MKSKVSVALAKIVLLSVHTPAARPDTSRGITHRAGIHFNQV